MSKRIIAIVAGGDSSENPVSLRSAATILEHMDKNRYEPYIVEIEGKSWQVHVSDGVTAPVDRNDFSFTFNGTKKVFDYAYITIHGTPGENGVFEGYLRLMRIPFSTCDVLASALTFNKFVLNKTMKSCKVNVANSRRLRRGDAIDPDKIISKVGLPCFIKPTDGGSSFGTTKVKTREQIIPAVEEAFKENSEIMIESFMQGIEVTNGYYKTRKREVKLPVTEVVPKSEFFDYDAKYNGKVEEITPARIPDELRDRIQDLTAKIYDLIGCHGIIRNDYIITDGDKINLLEVNTTPGMTATSFIPQQIRAAGMNLTDVFTEIIEDSF
ncbi:MAG: D-alanine--D-alanine ligase [Bacteroidaceae bacterium]|nr:D-alanine--D-alanine ligase [Bacteroidaceae bacterium]MBR4593582.1 D-alanine--D-alanine ligase [Bacteroidaceae bacterium]